MAKNLPASAGIARNVGLIPGSGRSAEGGHGKPTAVFIPEESLGLRSLAGYSPQGCRGSDMKQLSTASILAWEIPWTEEPSRLNNPWGCKESDMTE